MGKSSLRTLARICCLVKGMGVRHAFALSSELSSGSSVLNKHVVALPLQVSVRPVSKYKDGNGNANRRLHSGSFVQTRQCVL